MAKHPTSRSFYTWLVLILWAFCMALLGSSNGYAVTAPGTSIVNVATASYQVGGNPVTISSTQTIATSSCSTQGIDIQLMQYIASSNSGMMTGNAKNEPVAPGAYSPSGADTGPFVALPVPTPIGAASPLSLPGVLQLSPVNNAQGAPISTYSRNEPIFVRVVSYDSNVNPNMADTIAVKMITANSRDSEVIQLSETGLSSGVFTGYIPSASAAVGSMAVANDGKITISSHDETITGTYTHADCNSGSIASSSSGLFDPYGIIFDSKTGAPINGAKVTLVDAATGVQAAVFCDDGVTLLNQPLISGSPSNCGGSVAGGYRFPLVAAGNYKVVVSPPSGYSFASIVSASDLPVKVGTPEAAPVIYGNPGTDPLKAGASYGGSFFVLASPVKIDIPVDPGSVGSLQITKAAGKTIVGEGEFVPYVLTVSNKNTMPFNEVLIADRLPLGFRYVKGSAKLNGTQLPDPVFSADGHTLTFNVGTVDAGTNITLSYVAEVTVTAKTGQAENIAFSSNYSSNTARAMVMVREDLFKSKSILMGRVILGECQDDPVKDGPGLEKARIVLEDGTYIITDSEGRWHADNINPGTHVVQLDVTSLPKDYEAFVCQDNDRFAGRAYSQFVNLRAGTLWRADFHVRKKLETVTDVKLDAAVANNTGTSVSNTQAGNVSTAAGKEANVAQERPVTDGFVERLPYDAAWLAEAMPGVEWLHPQAAFQPALPVIKVAVKHASKQRLNLKVNGESVSPLLLDGTQQNTARTVSLTTWRGVPIKEGDNLFELLITDEQGQEVLHEQRHIHYATNASKAEFIPEHSILVADGKTKPVIAVRFLDKDGFPVRRGVSGEYQLNSPYESFERQDDIQKEPLARKVNGKPRFTVGENGIALIALMPTTQSGEAKLSFEFNDKHTQEIKTWLEAGQRDWILVGFAEGTVGHKKLSGNMQALKEAGADKELFDGDRVAFYAKGSIKGEYLLTMAYDTAKKRTDVNTGVNRTNGSFGANNNSNNPSLQQAIDPNRYYTLYGDATKPYFDAASARKLYLKIERKQFYALFGDFDTGLTVSELSRYSRTVNGVKSEYKGEKYGYNMFGTLSSQAYVKDEIRGDGTSGLYKLSRETIVANTDKIRIEVRDRFQSEKIISIQSLTRYLDYDIDYIKGTVFFKSPIANRDAGFNPTYIIVEYEAGDRADEKLTYGGRASFRPNAQTEIGASLIHEGNVGARGDLQGLDVTYQLTEATKLRAEVAHSDKERAQGEASGDAYLAEVIHHTEKTNAKIYLRQQDSGFGLGQQASSETGTRKVGAEGRIMLTEMTRLQGQMYRQDTLMTGAQRDVAEARVEQIFGNIAAYYGARSARDVDSVGIKRESQQALAGMSYELFDKKVMLRAGTELGLGASSSLDFPNRLLLGADYKLTEKTKAFVEQEFAHGKDLSANMTRIGLRTQPWTGAETTSSVGKQATQDGDRTAANLGLVQKWQVNERWQLDFGLDRSQTLSGENLAPINTKVPFASGSSSASSTINSTGTLGASSGAISTSDFTAVSVGANYSHAVWSANSRLEWRTADTDDRINFLLGGQRLLDHGRTMAAGLIYTSSQSANAHNSKFNARFSYAYRPNDVHWIWLDRLDLIAEQQEAAINSRTRKIINNFNANYLPNRRTQLALQYGAKYVLDNIDGSDYDGYTDLMAAEVRRDLDPDWDVGAHASMYNSWNSRLHRYALGGSIGYRLMENSWLTAGYNVAGFNDSDFSGAEYRIKGPYIALRIKFDQDTLKLNEKSKNLISMPTK